MALGLDYKRLFKASLILMITLTVSNQSIAQERSTDLKDFKLVVIKTADGIKMQGQKGSAWTVLSFDINNDRPQPIDEYGMTTLDKVSKDKDWNLANFLFTITKTKDGIVLKGIEGTAWTELKFSLSENSSQIIDQFGMAANN